MSRDPTAMVEEHAVRAAAGLTMATGAVAFSYAYFRHLYWPLQIVSTLFALEFLVRVTAGIGRSPFGVVAALMTRRRPAQRVSARPKNFAWTLGLAMSAAMAVITNVGIRGWLPRSICLVCLTLMWLESVLGLCVGCELHGYLVRHGRIRADGTVCADDVCSVAEHLPAESLTAST